MLMPGEAVLAPGAFSVGATKVLCLCDPLHTADLTSALNCGRDVSHWGDLGHV